MRNIIIASSLLILTGCLSNPLPHAYQPKYKVGDCAIFMPHKPEKWEKQEYYIERVINVGDEHYQSVTLDNACASIVAHGMKGVCFSTTEFRAFDEVYSIKAANCPRLEDLPGYHEE